MVEASAEICLALAARDPHGLFATLGLTTFRGGVGVNFSENVQN